MVDKKAEEILTHLGEGGYARVFKVEGTNRAVKIIRKNKHKTIAENIKKNFLDRERNFINMIREKSHPSLLEYFDINMEDEDNIKIYMELCDANLQNLLEYMKNPTDELHHEKLKIKKNWDFKEILDIKKDVVEGLRHIHNLEPRFAHRDIKPDNILINFKENGEIKAKVADWGISKVIEQENTITIGNHIYRDPITNKRADYDERVDIWSLGIVFYQLIYKGFLPFLNPVDQKTLPREVPWLRAVNK